MDNLLLAIDIMSDVTKRLMCISAILSTIVQAIFIIMAIQDCSVFALLDMDDITLWIPALVGLSSLVIAIISKLINVRVTSEMMK